ncbi:MAG: beta-ketoacyl-ACP synthase II, partial [Acetobacteraceae bacterium]
MRRVVITGLGMVCPLGLGVEAAWRRLVDGESGISVINAFNTDTLPSRIAGQVPSGSRQTHRLDRDEWFTAAEQRDLPRFAQLALIAASEALADAGWPPSCEGARMATGISIGSGCGALGTLQRSSNRIDPGHDDGAGTTLLQRAMIDHVAGSIANRFGLRGPRRVVSTACATGTHAIGDGARMIQFGDADVVLAGGTEAAICELGIAGFCAARALSTGFNDTPIRASRPWDRDRDGFVLSEGAGMVVLEDWDHARARNARIHAEVAGYGMSGDAYHLTAPPEGHDGAFRAMRAALRNARLTPDEIQYVNAHGTSTALGDDLELEAVERLFGVAARRLAISSTKSATGHLLGAAGAVEAIFSVLAIRDGVAPPTLNLESPSWATVMDRVAGAAQRRPIRAVLSNSFGFG